VLNSSKKRLESINPVVAYHVGRLITACEAEGIWAEICQGLRSWNEQEDLYAIGREYKNGEWHVVDSGKIVTKCRPGNSWHNFGLAIDICLDDSKYEGFQAVWKDDDIRWKKAAQIGKSLGFVVGADFRTFPDNPHYQMTGRFPVNPTDEVRQLFKDGGMQAVWDASGLK
jgi:peptidoglycan L-alanyl-D-glutamate endopeptidase CwlK